LILAAHYENERQSVRALSLVVRAGEATPKRLQASPVKFVHFNGDRLPTTVAFCASPITR